MRIILLSDDKANRQQARDVENVEAMSCVEYVQQVRQTDAPELLDVVAGLTADEDPQNAGNGATVDPELLDERQLTQRQRKKTKREHIFADHLNETDTRDGLKAGQLLQGLVKTSRYNAYEVGYLSCLNHG